MKTYTTIKTGQGEVRIPTDAKDLQKVVSLIYNQDIEIDKLKKEVTKSLQLLRHVHDWLDDESAVSWKMIHTEVNDFLKANRATLKQVGEK